MPRIALAVLVLGSLCGTGCTMCQSCFDYAYPHYGSIAERTDRTCGRVGSRFAPAGPDVGTLSPYKRETEQVELYSEGPSLTPERTETAPLPETRRLDRDAAGDVTR
jgi:hypothetical protein